MQLRKDFLFLQKLLNREFKVKINLKLVNLLLLLLKKLRKTKMKLWWLKKEKIRKFILLRSYQESKANLKKYRNQKKVKNLKKSLKKVKKRVKFLRSSRFQSLPKKAKFLKNLLRLLMGPQFLPEPCLNLKGHFISLISTDQLKLAKENLSQKNRKKRLQSS